MKLKVRFPNDDHYLDVDIESMRNFTLKKEFEDSMFGWWGDICVEVLKIKKDGEYVNPFLK
jgi:hypothetical protein